MEITHRIWRWSPIRRQFLEYSECAESQVFARVAAARCEFEGCAIAVERLAEKPKDPLLVELERVVRW